MTFDMPQGSHLDYWVTGVIYILCYSLLCHRGLLYGPQRQRGHDAYIYMWPVYHHIHTWAHFVPLQDLTCPPFPLSWPKRDPPVSLVYSSFKAHHGETWRWGRRQMLSKWVCVQRILTEHTPDHFICPIHVNSIVGEENTFDSCIYYVHPNNFVFTKKLKKT